MYAKVNGQQVVQYPYSLNLLKIEHPNTSFPSDMTEEDLASFGVVRVVVTGKPVHDAVTQGVREIAPELTVKGTWEQRWEIYSLPPEAVAANQAAAAQRLQEGIVSNTQKRLDEFAKTRNYDGILSACTYVTSAVPKFQVEGQYCVNARDTTWATLYQILAEVQAGTRPMPTGYDDVAPLLPVLEWPA